MASNTEPPEGFAPCPGVRNGRLSAGESETPRHASPPVLRYKLIVAYDGAAFHGWQRQDPMEEGGEPLRTVAGVLDAALMRLLGQPIRVLGASRTDAGVHALGQTAQFDASCRIPLERLAEAINSRLPDDVEVLRVEVVDAAFNAVGGARNKQYRYRIFNSPRRPLDRRLYVWHCWMNLDIDRMNQAAAKLVGTHDFAGFAAAGHGRLTTVRTIHACRVERGEQHPDEIHIVVQGDGFLYNMVRIIAGTLVDVGRGRLPPDVVDEVLKSKDRRRAGPTLPPSGLWLEWIEYA